MVPGASRDFRGGDTKMISHPSRSKSATLGDSYPVYDVARPDFTRDCRPIGEAHDEAEALALLQRYFDTGDAPAVVELMDRDTKGGQLWAFWPVWN